MHRIPRDDVWVVAGDEQEVAGSPRGDPPQKHYTQGKLGECYCCLPCYNCSNWTWVVEEILAYGDRRHAAIIVYSI